MKWVAIFVVAGVLAAATGARVAASSGRGSPPDVVQLKRDVAALQRQVGVLKGRVSKLNRRVSTLNKRLLTTFSETEGNYIGDGCLVAATADLFIATWATVDAFAQQTTGKSIFGPQAPFDDQGACSKLGPPLVTRQTNVPPSFSTYNALISWIRP
jgi:hypothetical protein